MASGSLIVADLAKLACPHCGIRYMDFRKRGRLGCPYDYIVFREGLFPLLDRVHRARRHIGKRPRRLQTPIEAHDETRDLRRRLRQAVETEDFQEAALVRDLLRARGQAHEA